jgi:hypothetical protein
MSKLHSRVLQGEDFKPNYADGILSDSFISELDKFFDPICSHPALVPAPDIRPRAKVGLPVDGNDFQPEVGKSVRGLHGVFYMGPGDVRGACQHLYK